MTGQPGSWGSSILRRTLSPRASSVTEELRKRILSSDLALSTAMAFAWSTTTASCSGVRFSEVFCLKVRWQYFVQLWAESGGRRWWRHQRVPSWFHCERVAQGFHAQMLPLQEQVKNYADASRSDWITYILVNFWASPNLKVLKTFQGMPLWAKTFCNWNFQGMPLWAKTFCNYDISRYASVG